MTTSDRYKNNELLFHQKIQSQLSQVRALLNTPRASSSSSGYTHNSNHQRSPVYFADYVKHTYQDKFGLAEFLTNVAIASQMNVLDVLGVDEEKFRLMHGIVNGSNVSSGENGLDFSPYANCNQLILRFAAEENCVKIEQDETVATEEIIAGTPGKLTRRKSNDGMREGPFFKKRMKEKEDSNHWKLTVDYSIRVLAKTSSRSHDTGSTRTKTAAPQKDTPPISLKSRTAETILHTVSDAPRPLQSKVIRDHIDFDLTWLFQNISNEDFSCNFEIDQSHKQCYTPRRNKDIDAAVKYFSELEGWCHDICTYFLKGTCWNVDSQSNAIESRLNLDSINSEEVFVPVLPIFEPPSSALLRKNDQGHGDVRTVSPLLPLEDIRLFLSEQCRTLDEKIHEVVSKYPSSESSCSQIIPDATNSLITSAEATIFLLFSHSASITEYFIDSLQAIEQSTVEVLSKACGKEVLSKDFDNIIQSSNLKLFPNEDQRPSPFIFDIRRPNRIPEGILRIEASNDTESVTIDCEDTWPIFTLSKEVTDASDGVSSIFQVQIPSIASPVKMAGKSHVHVWLTHQFAGQRDFGYQIRTSSRQFSSYIVLIGTICHNSMDIKNAMIVQNKDEVIIPMTFTRPRAAGDFPRLVSSLSPQQQAFTKSARGVQLESSVFAVCVIEIKPQLELLLDLPPNSLTKEVKLVRTLISLFVDHQLSADLVSYDGSEDGPAKEKIDAVRANVETALGMVNAIPTEETGEALTTEASSEDVIDEPFKTNNLFQRGNALKENRGSHSVATDTRSKVDRGDKISDDNTSIADMFRKKRSDGSRDHDILFGDFALRPEGEQFIIDPFPKSMRRVPSLDYLESIGRQHTACNSEITEVARKLNAKLKALKSKHLQLTAIETGEDWVQRNLLSPKSLTKVIERSEQEANTRKALDLLDALSRSGSLPLKFVDLHAIIGVTHCFSQSMIDTLVLDNVDPVKEFSDSTLLLSSVIHDAPVDSFTATKSL